MVVFANPRLLKILDWFLNRQKDYKDGNDLDMKLRNEQERLKKIREDQHQPETCWRLKLDRRQLQHRQGHEKG
ncbi:hypothetical protein P3L10_026717 [Capsicum annuum]